VTQNRVQSIPALVVAFFTVSALSLALIAGLPVEHLLPPSSDTSMKINPVGQVAMSGFEPNRGQFSRSVEWGGRFNGYIAYATKDSVVTAGNNSDSEGKGSVRTSLELIGARSLEDPQLRDRKFRVNYVVGSDAPSTQVAAHKEVKYGNVYPGIDFVLFDRGGELEYDFVVRPGADPDRIIMHLESSGDIRLSNGGDLIATDGTSTIRHGRPHVYQLVNGRRREIQARFATESDGVRFEVGDFDASKPLVIDPRVSFSTYLGGPEWDGRPKIAADPSGNSYISGSTLASEFPAGNQVPAGREMYVAKLSRTGELLYVTFLGGSGTDSLWDVEMSARGLVLAGNTSSTDFPMVDPAQGSLSGASDGFVTLLAPNGTEIVYSTYLGGEQGETLRSVAVGSDDALYIAGLTDSGFPLVNPWSTTGDGFVARIAPSGELVYSTRFMVGDHVAVDGNDAMYVAGTPIEGGLTTKNAFQPNFSGEEGSGDGFIGKLSPQGTELEYATYFGGTGDDWIRDLAVDGLGRAVFVGRTHSLDFPLHEAIDSRHHFTAEAFVSRLSPSGSALSFSSWLGGSAHDEAVAVDTGDDESVHVVGETHSFDFPTESPMQSFKGGKADAFWTHVAPVGSELLASSYFGGEDDDAPWGADVATEGTVHIAGTTTSDEWPVAHPAQDRRASAEADLFILKVGDAQSVDHRITIDKTGTGNGRVVSYPDGIDCGTQCSTSVIDGTVVNLTARVPEGMKFTSWGVPCTESDRCQIVAWRDATVRARFDEAVPPSTPVTVIRPRRLIQLRRSFRVEWSATDDESGVDSYDVGYFGFPFPPIIWKEDTAKKSARFTNASTDWTYCMTTAATDRADNRTDFGLYDCTTIPEDDAGLEAHGDWRRLENRDGDFNGTVSKSSTRGDRLLNDWSWSHGIALVATKCPGCGSVRVFFQRRDASHPMKLIREFDLSAPTVRRKQLMWVKRFDRWTPGRVQIVVSSRGRDVLIDGLAMNHYTERQVNR
jgi:hypothetical protein